MFDADSTVDCDQSNSTLQLSIWHKNFSLLDSIANAVGVKYVYAIGNVQHHSAPQSHPCLTK